MITNTETGLTPATINPNDPSTPPSACPINPIIQQSNNPPSALSTNPSSAPSIAPERRSRRNGKIARLPKKLRDLINELLSDGFTYPQIIRRLNKSTNPPLPYDISEKNLSNWHDGGYQEWLQSQERLEFLSSRLDFARDLAESDQARKVHELALQLAAIRICEFFTTLSIDDPHAEPTFYLRLLAALPRISREALNLHKYRDAVAARESLRETFALGSAPPKSKSPAPEASPRTPPRPTSPPRTPPPQPARPPVPTPPTANQELPTPISLSNSQPPTPPSQSRTPHSDTNGHLLKPETTTTPPPASTPPIPDPETSLAWYPD